MIPLLHIVAGVATWEGLWWARRRRRRQDVYATALARARQLGRPLVVVGAPDAWYTGGYGCGDAVFDVLPSSCPNSLQIDVTRPIPLADASVVVFVSCVFEYVGDLRAAIQELRRISGNELFTVTVEPWTLAGWLIPGTRHVNVERSLAR